MGNMLCRDHKCSSGIRHFQSAVSSNNTAMVSPGAKPRGPKLKNCGGVCPHKKGPWGQLPIFEFKPKLLLA